jgi:hypothetical protein
LTFENVEYALTIGNTSDVVDSEDERNRKADTSFSTQLIIATIGKMEKESGRDDSSCHASCTREGYTPQVLKALVGIDRSGNRRLLILTYPYKHFHVGTLRPLAFT